MTNSPSPTATVGSRIAAYAIDSLVSSVVVVLGYALAIIGLFAGSSEIAVVGFVVAIGVAIGYPVAYIVYEGRSGSTPGKRVVGIRTVDATTGRPIGAGRAFLRQLVLGVLGPINLIQLFTIPGHPRRQGWHDLAAGSVVLRADDPGVSNPEKPVLAGSGEPRLGPRPATPWPSPSVPNLATAPPASPPAKPPTRDSTHEAPSALPQVGPPPGIPTPPSTSPVLPLPVDSETGTSRPVSPPPPHGAPSLAVPVSNEEAATSQSDPRPWTLRTATGQQREISGSLLVGRDPDAGLVVGATAWIVDDPALSVSKTHARFGIDNEGPWVEDWHSTNGTTLHRQDAALPLSPHAKTVLREGDDLTLGDLRLTVSRRLG